jgi:hypothetical protein
LQESDSLKTDEHLPSATLKGMIQQDQKNGLFSVTSKENRNRWRLK